MINSFAVSLYPFAGVGRRKTKLKYISPTQCKSDAGDITELIENERSVSLQVDRLSYLTGIEADLRLDNRRTTATNILFLRGGINGPFRKEYYAKNDKRFDTGMNEAIWVLSFGWNSWQKIK